MEDTHLTCRMKIEKLLFILAIAFCWALKAGEIRTKIVAFKNKKHGRKEKSIFRVGFDWIRSAIAKASYKIDQFLSVMQALLLSIHKRRCL